MVSNGGPTLGPTYSLSADTFKATKETKEKGRALFFCPANEPVDLALAVGRIAHPAIVP
jgi:hypothetical protein